MNILENFNCIFAHGHTLQRSKMVHHPNVRLEVDASILPEKKTKSKRTEHANLKLQLRKKFPSIKILSGNSTIFGPALNPLYPIVSSDLHRFAQQILYPDLPT